MTVRRSTLTATGEPGWLFINAQDASYVQPFFILLKKELNRKDLPESIYSYESQWDRIMVMRGLIQQYTDVRTRVFVPINPLSSKRFAILKAAISNNNLVNAQIGLAEFCRIELKHLSHQVYRAKYRKKTLYLTLKKEWFDMIESGKKKEEYREIKKYWITRLIDSSLIKPEFYKFKKVIFTRGYARNARRMHADIKNISVGLSKPKWAQGRAMTKCFVIKIGKPKVIRKGKVTKNKK